MLGRDGKRNIGPSFSWGGNHMLRNTSLFQGTLQPVRGNQRPEQLEDDDEVDTRTQARKKAGRCLRD